MDVGFVPRRHEHTLHGRLTAMLRKFVELFVSGLLPKPL
jgi:hypothetical protein